MFLPDTVAAVIASKCTLAVVGRLARVSKEFNAIFISILNEMRAGLHGMPTHRQRFLLSAEYKEREQRAWHFMLREMSSLFPDDEPRFINLNTVAPTLRFY